MNTQDVISAIIRSEHGWAVAEQFEVTWDNRSVESVEQQNSNAMDYIMDTVNNLIKYNEVFNEDTIDEFALFQPLFSSQESEFRRRYSGIGNLTLNT